MSVPLPVDIDWELWRLLTDPRVHASKREIEEEWTLDDVLDAHAVLDAKDHADWLANRPRPTGAR